MTRVIFALFQFTEAFSKYGISDVASGSVLAVEIAEATSSNMDAITNLIHGELTDLSKLSQLADREGIKKVRFTWKRPLVSCGRCVYLAILS